MKISYLKCSIGLLLLSLSISVYALYSHLNNNAWLLAPPIYVLVAISVAAIVFGVKSMNQNNTKIKIVVSWSIAFLSVLLSVLLTLAFFISMLSKGINEHVQTVHSPDGRYTVELYRFNAGAVGPFGVRGELDGPLWFKKRIYYQQRKQEVNVAWENDHTITINNQTLNLDEGETFGF